MTIRLVCCCIYIIISLTFTSCLPLKGPEADYKNFVKIVNNYYNPGNGKAFYIDTTGHPPINVLVKQLDKHSWLDTLLSKESLEDRDGIGLEWAKRRDTLEVIDTFEGGPAEHAGIFPGDLLIQIDTVIVTGTTDQNKISELFHGKIGSVVVVKVLRGGRELLSFSIKRERISTKSIRDVHSLFIDSLAIGYIRIKTFSQNSNTQFEKALKNFLKNGMKGLLLDLRGCPGGYLDRAIEATKIILPKNSIIGEIRSTSDGREREWTEQYRVENTGYTNFPCVVLIDSFTAAGAEFMAGSLQKNKRATLIGTQTYGKGSVQRVYQINDTLFLRLTIGYLFLPGAKSFHEAGIAPDHYINEVVSTSMLPINTNNFKRCLADTSHPSLSEAVKTLQELCKTQHR